MTESLDTWRGKYGKDAGNEDDYVSRSTTPPQLLAAKGRTPQAKAAENATIDAWKKTRRAEEHRRREDGRASSRSTTPRTSTTRSGTPFAIKTRRGRARTSTAVQTQIAAQKASIDKIKKDAEDKYIALDQYGVLEASMAAKVRYGDIQYDHAQKIADIPVPKLIQNNDAAVAAFENARDAGAQEGARRGEGRLGRRPRQGEGRRRLEQVEPARGREPRARVPGRVPRAAPGAGAGDGCAMIATTYQADRVARRASIEACCARCCLCALVACGGGGARRPPTTPDGGGSGDGDQSMKDTARPT